MEVAGEFPPVCGEWREIAILACLSPISATPRSHLQRYRKNVDIGGRDGGNPVFLADGKNLRCIDSRHADLPYGRQLVDDILNRTETTMTQEHCFLATELALQAQSQAQKLEQQPVPTGPRLDRHRS